MIFTRAGYVYFGTINATGRPVPFVTVIPIYRHLSLVNCDNLNMEQAHHTLRQRDGDSLSLSPLCTRVPHVWFQTGEYKSAPYCSKSEDFHAENYNRWRARPANGSAMVSAPHSHCKGTKLTHIASATPGKFARGTPFGGQWPCNRHRSLDSVREHQADTFRCDR